MKIEKLLKICLFTILSFVIINTFMDDAYAITCRYKVIGNTSYKSTLSDMLEVRQNNDTGKPGAEYFDRCTGNLIDGCYTNRIHPLEFIGYGRLLKPDEKEDIEDGIASEFIYKYRVNISDYNIIKCNDKRDCCPQVLYAYFKEVETEGSNFIGIPIKGIQATLKIKLDGSELSPPDPSSGEEIIKIKLTEVEDLKNTGIEEIEEAKPCTPDVYNSLMTWAESQGSQTADRINDLQRAAEDKFRTAELAGECITADDIKPMIGDATDIWENEQNKFGNVWRKKFDNLDCILTSGEYNAVTQKYISTAKDKYDDYIDYLNAKKNEYAEKGCITEEEEKEIEEEIEEEEKKVEEIIEEIEGEAQKVLDELIQKLSGVDCKALIDQKLLDKIQKYMTWIRIVVPILLIVLGTVDFAKATLLQEKDENSKAFNTFIKRCVVAVIIFFLPSIISLLVNKYNDIIDKIPRAPDGSRQGIRITPMKDCDIK